MRLCGVESCSREVRTAGYCNAHYQRKRLGKNMDTPIAGSRKRNNCSIEWCKREAYTAGKCRRHYENVYRPQTPGQWGAWFPDAQGYIRRARVLNGKREVQAQHRFIMEEAIGRPLLPEENVHHLNGNRADNRPENLELWTTSQPRGQRVADKLAWAREILEIYGEP